MPPMRSYLEAAREQNDWLEDVLAGLLINGVPETDIEIRRFINDPLRIVVAVRGEPKYEHRIVWRVAPQ